MNTVRLLTSLLAPVMFVGVLNPGCTPETEPRSLEEALALASRSEMPLLIEFYSDG